MAGIVHEVENTDLLARVRPKFIGGERAIYDEHLKDG